MEDLNEKLTRLLSSPEGMEKIQSMMSALGGALPQEEAPPPPPMPPPAAGGIDMAALSKVLPLLGQMNQENEDTRLLAALRPYLHGQRAERLEESMRLLKLMKLLPLLTEGGVRNGG
jgi:hypothetical protein